MARARLKLDGFLVLLGTTLFTFIVHVLIKAMQKVKLSHLAAHTCTLKTSVTACLCVPPSYTLYRFSLHTLPIASASFY